MISPGNSSTSSNTAINPQFAIPNVQSNSRHVLVLVGPTASGKTPVSLLLARSLQGEIISADSRQVFRYMDIGTAKPDKNERKVVKHYFVDEFTPDQDFNAGEFGRKGRNIINRIFRRKKQPIVVGGSGLYIQSLIDGFFEAPPKDDELRQLLYQRLHREGASSLMHELQKVDPASALKIQPSNTRRIIRALEVYHLTGVPISQHHQHQRREKAFESVFVGLEWDRKKLYERINARVDAMIENGLIDEVRLLQKRGYGPKLNALQTVGYQEVFRYLEGRIIKQRLIELIKQNSRRYAKRQLTWFGPDKRIRWFRVESDEDFQPVALRIADYFLKS